ncbi:nitroreductase family protein [Tumebacillus permanentifrigoris]|uniref:Nitroreductase n=1 Tax=Tumebacillus permanentifrigoris TaxID=378543 RepID=A0A316D8E4_9BACL|nr:nitroreductase family protein [Tumebacillus permanentifrigoris]PWK12730.1 nitroreductase [Tumebacillus permanentifrigoris]
MNVIEAIQNRRNVKQFKPDSIAREKVLEWLQAAACAPNHRLTEPWEILWIGPETRAQIPHKNNFGGAPVLLAILSTPALNQIDRNEHYAAVSCFIQNFLLAAHADGVATGWSSAGAGKKVQELLGVPPGYEVVGILPVGYPAAVPAPKPRTPIEQKLRDLP